MVSKSRNVNGYVKAMRRLAVVQARLEKAEAKRLALREKRAALQAAAIGRRLKLTGGQMAEADRILVRGADLVVRA